MKYIFFFFVLFLFQSCNPFNYWNDSPIEEAIEEIIMKKSDVFVDLSGKSPDPSKLTQ